MPKRSHPVLPPVRSRAYPSEGRIETTSNRFPESRAPRRLGLLRNVLTVDTGVSPGALRFQVRRLQRQWAMPEEPVPKRKRALSLLDPREPAPGAGVADFADGPGGSRRRARRAVQQLAHFPRSAQRVSAGFLNRCYPGLEAEILSNSGKVTKGTFPPVPTSATVLLWPPRVKPAAASVSKSRNVANVRSTAFSARGSSTSASAATGSTTAAPAGKPATTRSQTDRSSLSSD